MYQFCMGFWDGPWANCARGKLLNEWTPYSNPLDLTKYLVYHVPAFVTCRLQLWLP